MAYDVIGRIAMRQINTRLHSVTNYDDPSEICIVLQHVYSRTGQRFAVELKLEHEYHGQIKHAKGYQIFSNDGAFVRSDGSMDGDHRIDEAKQTLKSADARRSDKYLTVSEFKQEIRRAKVERGIDPGNVLLWRPGYNLKPREPEPGNTIYNISRYYDDPHRRNRNDSSLDPMFDEVEAQVLQRFLGMRRR